MIGKGVGAGSVGCWAANTLDPSRHSNAPGIRGVCHFEKILRGLCTRRHYWTTAPHAGWVLASETDLARKIRPDRARSSRTTPRDDLAALPPETAYHTASPRP